MIDLLDKIRQAGGTVAVVGGDLRLRVPRGLLSAAERSLLAERKAEIVRLLADEPVVETPVEPVSAGTSYSATASTIEPVVPGMIDQDLDDEVEYLVPPPPCPLCGGFMAWWDFGGRPHCMDCEPTIRSERVLRILPQGGGVVVRRIVLRSTVPASSPDRAAGRNRGREDKSK